MGATETIAGWIVNTSYEDIPPEAIRVANESCFDLLGVILAGSTQPVGEIIQQYVDDSGGSSQATVLASGLQTSLANAALANGTMGHAWTTTTSAASVTPRWPSSRRCWPWAKT